MSPHVCHNSGENEWYTPKRIVESARKVLGTIDLDPASSAKAQETVKAMWYYTLSDDGLASPWGGKVFLNPPYKSDLIKRFVAKLISEPVSQAITLTNNATETYWGQSLLCNASVVCYPSRRVRFIGPNGEKSTPLQGQMICGLKVNIKKFISEFEQMGICLVRGNRYDF